MILSELGLFGRFMPWWNDSLHLEGGERGCCSDVTVAFTWLGKASLRVVLSGNEVGMNYILSPAANGQPFSEWPAGMKIVAYTHY